MKLKKIKEKSVDAIVPAEPKLDNQPAVGDDFKDFQQKHNLSKYEYELFKDEDYVKSPVIRVKRVSLPNKGENWKIYNDTKIIDVIEGVKLGIKEREFLRGIDGVQFLVAHCRSGWKSFNAFKTALKAKMKE
jgi:hypothetical protein